MMNTKAHRISMQSVILTLALSAVVAGPILGPILGPMLSAPAPRTTRTTCCPSTCRPPPNLRVDPVDTAKLDDLRLIRDTPELPPVADVDEPGFDPKGGR